MTALAQLLAVAGQSMPAGFAGTCVDCGRSMYKQNSKPDERLDSWVEKTTSTSCRTCYQRARGCRCAFCLLPAFGSSICSGCRSVWDQAGIVRVADAGRRCG